MMVDKSSVKTSDKNRGTTPSLYQQQNLGFTHHLEADAANALLIRGMFDTYARHTIEMAAHNAFAPISSDLMKILNHNTGTEDVTLKDVMEVKLGKQAEQMFVRLVEEVNGIKKSDDGGFLQKLYGNAKAASIAANISVMIQQPTAYIRAAALMNPKYLTQAIVKKGDSGSMKERMEVMHKYAPLTLLKSWGGADINVGKSNMQIILDNQNTFDRIKEFTMVGAGAADDITWFTLWNACLLETADTTNLKAGTDEFYKAAALKMNDLIAYTQVIIDTPFHRPQIMKGKGLNQLYTQFMSEPIKSVNLLRKGIREARQTGNANSLVRTSMAMLVTNIVNSAAKSVIYALRDDEDRDEEGNKRTYADKWLDKFKDAFSDEVNIFKNIQYISTLWDTLETAIKGEYKYSDDALYEKGVNQIVNAAIGLFGETTGKEKCKALVDAVSTLTGVGAGNIWRDVEAIINTLTPEEKEIREKYFSDFSGEEDTLNEILAMYLDGYMEVNNDVTAPSSLTVDGEKIALSTEEKQDYMLTYNVMYSAIADGVRLTDIWDNLTEEQKARAYENVKSKAKEAAKYSIIGYPENEYGEEVVKSVEDYAEACIYNAVTTGTKDKEEAIEKIQDTLNMSYQQAHEFYQYYGQGKTEEEAEQAAKEAFATKGEEDILKRELQSVDMTQQEYDTYMSDLNAFESTKIEGENVEGSKYSKKLSYISSRIEDKEKMIYLAKKVSSEEDRKVLREAEQKGILGKNFLKMYSNYVQIQSEKDGEGNTITNSKKQNKLGYISDNCIETQADILLKDIIGDNEEKQAVYALVKKAGYDLREFAGWYSGAVTEKSGDDIDTYLYTISGDCPNTAQELIYLLQAPSGTKYEYNVRMKRVLKKIPGLTQSERDKYESMLARS